MTDYQWEATLNDFGTEQNVQTLTLTVHWVRRTEPHSLALTTVVFIPGSTLSSTTAPGGSGGLSPGLGGLP